MSRNMSWEAWRVTLVLSLSLFSVGPRALVVGRPTQMLQPNGTRILAVDLSYEDEQTSACIVTRAGEPRPHVVAVMAVVGHIYADVEDARDHEARRLDRAR
jgi:hypothetical protein